MVGLTAAELSFLVVWPALGPFLLYWVIRLAVRHAMKDVEGG